MSPETRTILENNTYLVLSTVSQDGTPWAVPVHFAFDDENIYWISADSAVHSKNLETNDKSFLVIYNSQQDPADHDERSAVYISTTSRALDGEEAIEAHDVYARKFTTSQLPSGGAHIYVAPIGVANESKTKAKMMYYHPANSEATS